MFLHLRFLAGLTQKIQTYAERFKEFSWFSIIY